MFNFNEQDIENLINKNYEIAPINKVKGTCVKRIQADRKGKHVNYIIHAMDNTVYFLKIFEKDDIRINLYKEIEICNKLNNKKLLRTSEFVQNKSGEYLTEFETGYICQLKKFIKGKTWKYNTAPNWLLDEGIRFLTKIHRALPNENLPLSYKFVDFNNINKHLAKFENLLEVAKPNKTHYSEIINDLEFKMNLIKHQQHIDFDRLTMLNSHNDYFITQIITEEQTIKAIIDFSEVALVPASWEIIRFYFHSAPECSESYVDKGKLSHLFKLYMSEMSLNEMDIILCIDLLITQVAQSAYGYCELLCCEDNKYIEHAMNKTKVIKYLNDNKNEILDCISKK